MVDDSLFQPPLGGLSSSSRILSFTLSFFNCRSFPPFDARELLKFSSSFLYVYPSKKPIRFAE